MYKRNKGNVELDSINSKSVEIGEELQLPVLASTQARAMYIDDENLVFNDANGDKQVVEGYKSSKGMQITEEMYFDVTNQEITIPPVQIYPDGKHFDNGGYVETTTETVINCRSYDVPSTSLKRAKEAYDENSEVPTNSFTCFELLDRVTVVIGTFSSDTSLLDFDLTTDQQEYDNTIVPNIKCGHYIKLESKLTKQYFNMCVKDVGAFSNGVVKITGTVNIDGRYNQLLVNVIELPDVQFDTIFLSNNEVGFQPITLDPNKGFKLLQMWQHIFFQNKVTKKYEVLLYPYYAPYSKLDMDFVAPNILTTSDLPIEIINQVSVKLKTTPEKLTVGIMRVPIYSIVRFDDFNGLVQNTATAIQYIVPFNFDAGAFIYSFTNDVWKATIQGSADIIYLFRDNVLFNSSLSDDDNIDVYSTIMQDAVFISYIGGAGINAPFITGKFVGNNIKFDRIQNKYNYGFLNNRAEEQFARDNIFTYYVDPDGLKTAISGAAWYVKVSNMKYTDLIKLRRVKEAVRFDSTLTIISPDVILNNVDAPRNIKVITA